MTFDNLKSSTSSTASSTPGSPSSKSLKIVWQEEIRRLPFSALANDIQALKDLSASCFGIKNSAGLIFTYVDAEGDTVTLSTVEELREIVEASPATIKLILQRKIKVKPQAAPTEAPKAASVETETTADKPQKQNNKQQWKEKKQQLRQEILHTKVVRIRWRTSDPTTSTPSGENKKFNADKGCFVAANFNGKIKFGAGSKTKNGLWLIRELKTGEVILAPLNSSKSHLRVFLDGHTNLTERGAGPRARWNLVKSEDKSSVSVASLEGVNKVQLVSRFAPDFHLAVVQEFNKKNKPVLRARGVNATATAFVSEFTLEVQDPMEALVKFASNVTHKKKALKNVLKRKEDREEEEFVGKKHNKNFNKLNKNKDINGNKKDPNWANMTKQQRMEVKAARKLEKLEKKRLKMSLKKKM